MSETFLSNYSLWSVFFIVVRFIFLLSPLWLPVVLALTLWEYWIRYIRARFEAGNEHILLEIRMPKEINKTPTAMELFLNSLFQTGGEATFIDRIWKGKTRPWFSLEIASIEGQVRFFIWTRAYWKPLILSQIYAQYPNVEVDEVQDYTDAVPYFDPAKVNLWGCNFELTKPDPYPIKTYVDYGMTKEIKDMVEGEKAKLDPITPMIEYMGSVGRGEQVWFQIIIRANKKEKLKPGTIFGKTDWKEEGKEEIKKLQAAAAPKEEGGKGTPLTKGQNEVIEAIEKSIAKIGFDCGIRGIYIADKDVFNPVNIAGLTGSVRQYNSNTLNGFKPKNTTSFDYPWQDYKNVRINKKKKGMLTAYRNRGYFFYPHKDKNFVLTVEELATIYHFPGGMVQTPTFERIGSKKGEAPPNLPV